MLKFIAGKQAQTGTKMPPIFKTGGRVEVIRTYEPQHVITNNVAF